MKLRTRFLFLLLILAMLCSLLPQFTLPARGDNPNAGSCGEKLSWYFADHHWQRRDGRLRVSEQRVF